MDMTPLQVSCWRGKFLRWTQEWYSFNYYLYMIEQWALRTWVSWWRHQMETFSAILAICAGNSPVPGAFPAQRPVTRSFDGFFFISAWINAWVNNREAGDLRRHHGHYDVIVMVWCPYGPNWGFTWNALISGPAWHLEWPLDPWCYAGGL